MDIQLALDRLTRQQCLDTVKAVHDLVDYVELGTGVIKQYGVGIITEIKERFAGKKIVADMKTCDAGRSETELAFGSGADVTTVMAFSDERTVRMSLEVAAREHKDVMIDLLGMSDAEKIRQLHEWGARLFCLHRGKDSQPSDRHGRTEDGLAQVLKNLPGVRIAYAGGISHENIDRVLSLSPNIVVIGSAITGSPCMREAAFTFRRKCDGHENMA
jgi:3-hexulose-6-phosphate synthase